MLERLVAVCYAAMRCSLAMPIVLLVSPQLKLTGLEANKLETNKTN